MRSSVENAKNAIAYTMNWFKHSTLKGGHFFMMFVPDNDILKIQWCGRRYYTTFYKAITPSLLEM